MRCLLAAVMLLCMLSEALENTRYYWMNDTGSDHLIGCVYCQSNCSCLERTNGWGAL